MPELQQNQSDLGFDAKATTSASGLPMLINGSLVNPVRTVRHIPNNNHINERF